MTLSLNLSNYSEENKSVKSEKKQKEIRGGTTSKLSQTIHSSITDKGFKKF